MCPGSSGGSPPGAAVTPPPSFADIVATKHGVADLRVRTLDRRAYTFRAITYADSLIRYVRLTHAIDEQATKSAVIA